MTVESVLELYVTIFAWQQYNSLWALLMETGIALVPFIIILFKNYVEPVSSQASRDASATSLRRMELDIVLALSVVVLAGQPVLPFHASTLSFEPPCEEWGVEKKKVTAGNTGTSYDSVFKALNVKTEVPIWWYGVLALSGGATRAAIKGIECPVDVSGLQVALDANRVDSSVLMGEMERFREECFVPARSKFHGTGIAITDPATVAKLEALFEEHGADDIDWPGSHILQEIPGFYDRERAEHPVPGWPYDASRDYEAEYNE